MSTRIAQRPSLRIGTVALVVTCLAFPMLAPTRPHVGPTRTYVVRALNNDISNVGRRLRTLGANVTREFGALDEAVVRMDASTAALATHVPGVAAITSDANVHLASDRFDTSGTNATGYDPTTDNNSMYNLAGIVGASDVWDYYTGRGVDVAVLDSGVSPVDGLNTPGKIVYGPDLSFDSQNANLENLDGYGHGTHIAGIIAGHDAGANPTSDDSRYDFLGIAPDARIVSVKLADAYGATDVSQVIAGIDWVVQHAHDPGLNIRVINLSFGTPSTQDASLDPLAYAAEVAWRHGIVVVVSAGNNGTTAGRLADPAIDPWVIAVGADDPGGTRSTDNDVVPSYSSRGDGTRNPDLVAPGAHVQSLRVPGSQIDDQYGAGAGSIDGRFLRGSGTSQAAAMVSGSVALLLQQRPRLTPDQVKAILTATASPLPDHDPTASGAGLVNVRRATRSLLTLLSTLFVQSPPESSGTGLLDGARGAQQLVLNGVPLSGEIDIFGAAYDTTARAAEEDSATSWDGGTWNGRTWAGPGWSGTTWQPVVWTDASWAGTDWIGVTANDGLWDGRRWADATWMGRRWAFSQWSGSNFDGGNWAVGAWN